MSGSDLIEPDKIPQFTGDLEQLESDAVLLGAEASAFRFAGADVHAKFQGLSACYSAPEADQLFATTAPVATKADRFADDLEKVGAALSAYAAEIQPLVVKLKSIKRRAQAFRTQIAGDDHWREDDDNVQLNNDLVHDVNATAEAFWQAEIACHNKITALAHGTTLVLEDGSQKKMREPGTHSYRFTAALLDQAENLPWGRTVEKERHGLDWLGHQIAEVGKGFFVDGVWGTVQGLGTLVGFDGLDAMFQAWDGLGKLVTGVALTVAAPHAFWLTPKDKLPAYLRESRQTVVAAGKALVAYDEWGTSPARAGGAVTFNVLTTVFTGGAGAAAKGGAVAKTVAALGKASRVVDPMTYLGKVATFGTVKVADLFSSLKGVHSGAYSDVLSGAGRVPPDGSVVKIADEVPVVHGNYVQWPDGTRLDLDDGSVIRADGTHAPAKVELSAEDRAVLEQTLPHRDAVLVGAGDNAAAHTGAGAAGHLGGDATAHTGGNATAHVGEHSGGHGSDTLSPRDTGGHATGGDHASGGGSGGGADGGPVPAQHGGSGGGHGDSGGHDGQAPGGNDPLAREREIMRRQVERANNDPRWFRDHYRKNGYRRSATADGGYGQDVPQLVRNPFAPPKWIAVSDMPPPMREHYIHNDPVLGHRSAAGEDTLHRLDEQAAKRDHAIALDKAAEDHLKAAEKAYAAAPTQEFADAMHQADTTHSPLHGDANRQSELFGEDVAEHHAVPEHYPDAVRVDDGAFGNNRFDQVYRTADGRYVVVEAKGSLEARLGVRKGLSGRLVTQGTREYFQTILDEMEKRAIGNEKKGLFEQADAERILAEELRGALKGGKVDYVLVKAKADGAQYAGYKMKQFDITK